MRAARLLLILTVTVPAVPGAACRIREESARPGRIPVTTSSPAARKEYQRGRDLVDKLRGTDARGYFLKAVKHDPSFALAHVGLANTAATGPDFFVSLDKAVALVDRVSPGEAHIIRALQAAVTSRPDEQLAHLLALVEAYPKDERAHTLLGNLNFGRQQWGLSIECYKRAIAINPEFSQPYNQLGYALRFLEKYVEAEEAFRRYAELIPDEPNPYDSYGELLMKVGRFSDAVDKYRRALEINPNFANSYVGLGNALLFDGKVDDARKAFAKLAFIARNDGERRQACTWVAAWHLHQGDFDGAVEQLRRSAAIAEADGDCISYSADLDLIALVLLEAGRADEAEERFAASLRGVEKCDVSEEMKENARVDALADQARVAIARGRLDDGRELVGRYRDAVTRRGIGLEILQAHELGGALALARGDHATAVKELEFANQQDPEVLYRKALAYAGAGDCVVARNVMTRAANFNGLAFNYGFVRARAKRLLASEPDGARCFAEETSRVSVPSNLPAGRAGAFPAVP
jgi:tetratricopeptide (TPR) repeat protein